MEDSLTQLNDEHREVLVRIQPFYFFFFQFSQLAIEPARGGEVEERRAGNGVGQVQVVVSAVVL
jgi:hypothetical protein